MVQLLKFDGGPQVGAIGMYQCKFPDVEHCAKGDTGKNRAERRQLRDLQRELGAPLELRLPGATPSVGPGRTPPWEGFGRATAVHCWDPMASTAKGLPHQDPNLLPRPSQTCVPLPPLSAAKWVTAGGRFLLLLPFGSHGS